MIGIPCPQCASDETVISTRNAAYIICHECGYNGETEVTTDLALPERPAPIKMPRVIHGKKLRESLITRARTIWKMDLHMEQECPDTFILGVMVGWKDLSQLRFDGTMPQFAHEITRELK